MPVIWIADTMGELGLWYRLAPIAFVGRSLIAPGGGQNPLEPARLGCAIAVGPHTGNFTDHVALLRDAGGLVEVQIPPRWRGSCPRCWKIRISGSVWASMPPSSVQPTRDLPRAYGRGAAVAAAGCLTMPTAPAFWSHDGILARTLSPLVVHRRGADGPARCAARVAGAGAGDLLRQRHYWRCGQDHFGAGSRAAAVRTRCPHPAAWLWRLRARRASRARRTTLRRWSATKRCCWRR